MSQQNHQIYEFGPFRLDEQKRLLLRDGKPVKLFPKEFDTLLALVQRSGEMLDKDELLRKVWPDSIVEEGNLTTYVSHLRKLLGESRDQHDYIVTIPGKGYQFVAGVHTDFDEVIVHERTRGKITVEEEPGAQETTASAATRWNPGLQTLIFLAFALLVGLTVTVYLRVKRADPRAVAAPIRSIAVLPFKPLESGSRDEALELGMADTLIARLSNISQLNVRPTSAVRKYAQLEQDAVAAGRELKVDAVLDGSIQRTGDRVRVTARLLRIEDGTPLWAETFNEKLTDVFAVQDSISKRVAATLAVKLIGNERELVAKRDTENTEAYQAYLTGRYLWNQRTEAALKKSIDYFERAVEIDPEYALAYVGLADSHGALLAWSNVLPDESFPKAKAAALKALEIDDTLAEAHAALAQIKIYYEWDWAGAEKECKRAIELNPNYATAHQYYSKYLYVTGRFDEGLAEIRTAQQLDPLSIIIRTDEGQILYFARRYDEAIEKFRETLEMDPHFMRAHVMLGAALVMKGRYEEAISEYLKAGLANGGIAEGYVRIGAAMREAYATSGERGYWAWWLDRFTERAQGRPILQMDRARCYMFLGEKDQAFAWFEKAFRHKEAELVTLKVDPTLDSLRSDPRFKNLMRRIGLAS
jgi:DNA-binding winged helix-turn-helix (wHTH) protein/TolB-like protein/Flp pilus assembly protein TadD